jgi:hypothetical protein
MIIHLYMRISGHETSSWLAGPGSQWAVVAEIIIIIIILNL